MEQKQEETIGQILDSFDFENVHEYMKSVNWTWFDGVPSPEVLRQTAARLLVNAMTSSEETICTGSGGFIAYKFPWGLELIFAIERRGSF